MPIEFKPGERVEITNITKGGFFKGRYRATVISTYTNRSRIKVLDDEGNQKAVYIHCIKKLA